MKVQYYLLLFTCILIWPSDGSNILVMMPMSPKSHKIGLDALMEELSKRDHKITEVTIFNTSRPHKNIRTVFLSKMREANDRFHIQSLFSNSGNSILFTMKEFVRESTAVIMDDNTFREFMANPGHYDAVITGSTMYDNVFSLISIIAPETPLILYSPSSLFTTTAWSFNVPTPTSYVPVLFTPFDSKMTFFQRVVNILATGVSHLLFLYIIRPAAHTAVQSHLPDVNVPYPNDVEKNASLVLVNSHFSLGGSKPSMPYVVDVGGMHCQPAQALPQEFLNFVEGSADDGFIVFSLGSIIQGKLMPKSLIESFKYAFKEISPIRVIWKFEEQLEGLSPNVLVSKWIPQQDLIGHRKCKLAITHGGLLSLQEVNYHGVPVLGIPLGLDRDSNLQLAVKKGIAKTLEKDQITPERTLETIKSMLEDKSFKENAKKFGQLVRDRPQSPVQSASYWVEYVIRHKGAPHLKSEAENLNLVQYFLIDVFAFLFALLVAILYAIYFLIKVCCKKLSSNKIKSE